MSAFIVSRTHIDVIVSGAVDVLPDLPRRHGAADAVGQILWKENVRSVVTRYPQIGGSEEARSHLFAAETYRHTRYYGVTHAALAKAIHCLDYQSCETDDWPSTPAYAILDEIEAAILRALPGYEQAPWGITRGHIISGSLSTGGR